MLLSFSTLACPDWTLNEILSAAKDLGYNGIEIRGLGAELCAPKLKAFNDDLAKTAARLKELGLSIPILSSAAALGVHSKNLEAMGEAYDYIALAHKLGVKYIRVMFTDAPYPDGGDIDLFVAAYSKLCLDAEPLGVTPIVETNGLFTDTSLLKKALSGVKSQNKGVLWDVNHTYRYNNESVSESLKNIGSLIKHVHLKDSLIEKGKPSYKLIGYGDVPVKEAVNKLKAMGYQGYYSLEWVKRWQKDLEEPGIVLAQFIDAIKAD